ncbi:transposase [Micromonospora sp. KC606]|uniref:transposase n=1 Tax=Micromonospora sp. KC606 TaxID=2530379 RepID=UPI001FB7BC19|nr:transposase [Micromonospora sp. KC606]
MGSSRGSRALSLNQRFDAELDAHLDDAGVDEATGRRTNIRNGHGAKTVQTEVGPVRIQVPRDRAGSFTPRIVPRHARRLDGFNEAILSLYAKGLTTGEISAHLADVYDADVSRELISRVTPTVAAAEARFEAFAAEFGDQYPAVIKLWRTSWPQFVPFLDNDHEVRKALYTTNIIEILNARFRQAARRRGHFPTEQAAMKILYLAVQQKRRGGGSTTAGSYGWAKALNALILAYSDRITI